MTAMQQRTPEWYTSRIGKITASRAGAILGLSPYATPADVMREMVREAHGAEKEFTGNIATEWGVKHEADALADLGNAIGLAIEPGGFHVHPEHDWLTASPDGICFDFNSGVIEIKCPYNQKQFDLSTREDYYAQIQIQMACTGLHYGYFAVWTPASLSRELVTADTGWLDRHLPALKLFYDEYQFNATCPKRAAPFLADKTETRDDIEWEIAAHNYRTFKAAADIANKALDEAKDVLLGMAKESGRTCKGAGVQVVRSEREGSVDTKAMQSAGIDVSSYRKPSTVTWTVRDAKE